MDKFITKDTIFIAVVVVWMVLQAGIFATKVELAGLKNELLQQKLELQKYSDEKDQELLNKLDMKYEIIIQKIEKLRK